MLDLLQMHRAVRWRLYTLLFLESSLWAASFCFFVGGTIIVFFRAVEGLANPSMAWVLVVLILSAAFGAWQAWRRIPDNSVLMALLDRENNAGGLIMAAAEKPIGVWNKHLGRFVEPVIIWHKLRSLKVFAAALIFLLLTSTVPQQILKPITAHHLNLEAEQKHVKDKIDVLKVEKLISPTQAEKLEDKLSSLLKEASGDEPTKTYEALDHLEELLAKSTSQAFEKILVQNQKLENVRKAAIEALKYPDSINSSNLFNALKEKLEFIEEKASFETPNILSANEDLYKSASKNEIATPDQIRKVIDNLDKAHKDLESKLTKLAKAGLIDKKTLETFKINSRVDDPLDVNIASIVTAHSFPQQEVKGEIKEISGESESLQAKESDGELVGINALGGENFKGGGKPLGGEASGLEGESQAFRENSEGKGGISRGRGDAPLYLNGTTHEGKIGFKDLALPPSREFGNGYSRSGEVGFSGPAVESQIEPTETSNFTYSDRDSAAAYSHRILPQHKFVVKRYFQRQEGGK